MTERNLKIEQRIAHVKRDLCEQGIAKANQTNFGGKYKYRGVDSTMATVSSLHAKYGVNFSINRIDHFNVAQQGNNTHITCLFVMRFSSSDDKSDYVEHVCIGEGFDQGDKASGKAHSYAYKNGMFSFYEIPVEGQEVDSYDPRIDNEASADKSELDAKSENSIPMPDKVKDAVREASDSDFLGGAPVSEEKGSPAKEVKELRAKQKAKKAEKEEHQKLSLKEQAIERLSNASATLAEFCETDTYSLEEGKQARKFLVDILNKDKKLLELTDEADSVVREMLKHTKEKITRMETSKTSEAVADLARKKMEEMG